MCNLSHLARRLSQGQIRIRAIISKWEKHPLSQRVSCDFTFSKNQYFPKLATSFEQKEYNIFTHLSHGNEQNTADRSQERQSFQGSHRVTQAFLYSSKAEICPQEDRVDLDLLIWLQATWTSKEVYQLQIFQPTSTQCM